jgi:hypothetical protein
MARTFSHDYLFGVESSKALRCRYDEERMGIDGVARRIVDQIGFENDVLPSDIQRKQPHPRKKNVEKVLRVLFNVKDSDPRSRRSADLMILGFEEKKRNRSTRGDRGASN